MIKFQYIIFSSTEKFKFRLKEDVVYDDIEEVEEVKPVTTKKHATIVEKEVDEFEYVDFDECYDY
jgi:hypothetical protein